jgi:membrane-associated phospholipid phosphatase
MHWLQSLDTGVFRFVNGSLSNWFFDLVMPVLSGAGSAMHWFMLALIVAFASALVYGNARARICAVMLLVTGAIGDGLIVNTIKHAVARPRPCIALSNVVERLGCTTSGSMPSAHAANWFAATMIVFIFYPRKRWLTVPMVIMATAVAFSRVYNGVHYPGDVLAGAILGSGYAVAIAVLLEMAWQYVGGSWFPLWHARMPSLLNPEARGPEIETVETEDSHWLRLGYVLILASLIGRWLYLASGRMLLSGDEAYQWLWSKHLALSYYSKPPGIAWLQFAGTRLCGDTELGVRFFSPLLAAILSWVTVRFLAREIGEGGGRVAFWFLLIVNAVPLLAAGSVIITIDPPQVLFWTLALVVGWRAVQPDGQTRDWLAVGLAMGLAFLFKYNALYQIICFGIFFALWQPSRIQLRKPGPWLALLIFAICMTPVIIWNAEHQWITIHHVKGNAGLNAAWKPTLKYLGDFLGSELGVLNPVFFIAAMFAMFAFWKQRCEQPLMLYLFCMSAPVFFGHLLYSLHSQVQPNWIAPAVPGMFLLMVLYWNDRLRAGSRLVKPFMAVGLALGFLVAAIMYDPDLVGKIAGAPLPAAKDPSYRLHGWDVTARTMEDEREKLAVGGKPAFIIAGDYGMASELTFYSPAARKAEALKRPMVYCVQTDPPTSQFDFWPEYNYRATRDKGENALYIMDIGLAKPEPGWFWKWLRHEPIPTNSAPAKIPPGWQPPVYPEFETIQDLGRREITVKGQPCRRVHIWACYNLQ